MATEPFWQETEDWHTEGMPFRIVSKLPPNALDSSLKVSQQRSKIIATPSHPLNLLRQCLCREPAGRPEMYGCFVFPPNDSGAHFGVLFWHNDGFSTACGHGTIALGYWAVAHGIVQPQPGGTADIMIDVPSGRVVAKAIFDDAGAVKHMDFINVASQQIAGVTAMSVEHAGSIVAMDVKLAFAGAVIASINAGDVGCKIEPSNIPKFIDVARKLKPQYADHEYQGSIGLAGVCFYEDMSEDADAIYQKNVVVFADGQIDRSPCGSGSCARLAILLAEGKVSKDKRLVHESIIGTSFEAHIVETMDGDSFPSCISLVRGTAHLVGRMNFFIDPEDPIYPGFVLG